MQWQIEPMPSWPYPETKGRKGNPFRAKFDSTMSLLKVELEHLKVQGAVAVRVVADAADVRQDGMLRAKANVRHPGVALSFTSALHVPLTYPSDAFYGRYYGEVDWQINLRAIALGLAHLRTIDRYGIAVRGEQYAGWRAIEAASKSNGFASADDALRWLASFADVRPGALVPKDLIHAASKRAHPDVGGDQADWDRVDAARQLLQKARVIV